MDLLIKNGLIVTMDRDRRVMEGSISIKDGEIIEVDTNFEEKSSDNVIDAEGKIVMPGLVCSHTRPYGILLQAAPLTVEPPSDFVQILRRIRWPIDESLSEDDIYVSALASCLDFIKTGITFFSGIHSSQGNIGKSLNHIASAVEEAGLRACVGYEASERHTRAEGARGMKENIRFLENIQKKGYRESRVNGMVCLGNSFVVSDELLRYGKRVANRFDVPIVVSTSEGKIDLYHNLEKYGVRTIERFRDAGILSTNTVLAHSVHVNEKELEIIEKTGANVAHVPMRNMLNAVGISPVLKMRNRDIPVGLGNNGNMRDMFENLRILYLVYKGTNRDPQAISPIEILEMATIKGAELYGMKNKIGSIEPGKRADIIIIDPSRLPTPVSRENAADQIVNAVRGDDIETVMVGGDLLMEEQNVKSLNEERVIKKTKETSKKVWKKLESIKR